VQLSDDVGTTDELRRDWRTLLGATLGVAISTPGLNFYTLGVMMPFLIEFAGRTREEISVVQFLFSAIVAVFAPVAGALMDRFGVLRVAAISLLIESTGFAMLGASAHILPLFALSMMSLALFGLGTTPLGYGRIVSATFDKRRGIALGLMICGVGTMAVLSPIVLNAIIERSSWRAGYYALAAIVLVIGGSGILILRGTQNHPARQRSAEMSEGGSWIDLRKPLFWLLVLGFCLPAILGGRSEERRVGKECRRLCRSRWSPYH
jgi:MFS family permease